MIDALNVALSSQMALERRLATLADNVANSGTTGFRATSVRFEETRHASAEGADRSAFVSRGRSFVSTASGAVEETGGPLDVAVRGEAWFAIGTAGGPSVTRDGRFVMNSDGGLLTLTGEPVLDAGGAPVQIAPGGGPPTIAGDGSISQGGQVVSAIGLFRYEPGSNPERVGTSAVRVRGALTPVTDEPRVGVMQGFLERSNVDPVREMTRLIRIHRDFDNVAAAIRDAEGATEAMIETLGSSR